MRVQPWPGAPNPPLASIAAAPSRLRPTRPGGAYQGSIRMARLVTETDRAIIRLLQRDARMSYAELSRATGIPESTVRRRMDRLQQRGVIEFAMLADPVRLGYEVRAMIGLRVELRRLEEIAAKLRAIDEVTFAAFLTGNFDIMIHVVVRSQDALVNFLTGRLAPIEGVRSSETFVMPYVIKPTTAWVLPEADRPALDEAELDELTLEQEISTATRGRGRPGQVAAR